MLVNHSHTLLIILLCAHVHAVDLCFVLMNVSNNIMCCVQPVGEEQVIALNNVVALRTCHCTSTQLTLTIHHQFDIECKENMQNTKQDQRQTAPTTSERPPTPFPP